jgi:V-type H+-transporting ATPase subunit E
MAGTEAQQTTTMVNFILAEAKNKAEEIEAMTTQSFTMEKAKILATMKAKVRREFQAKEKKIESQRAISRSRVVNESRLLKVAERGKFLDQVTTDVKNKLLTVVKDQRTYSALLTDLIVQGALTLLEPEIKVRCRQIDQKLVQAVLPAAQAEFSKVVKSQTGVDKSVSLSIDPKYLPPAPGTPGSTATCLGGVVLACHGGLITVDNTLDLRLRLIVEQDKPAIRRQLFNAEFRCRETTRRMQRPSAASCAATCAASSERCSQPRGRLCRCRNPGLRSKTFPENCASRTKKNAQLATCISFYVYLALRSVEGCPARCAATAICFFETAH